MLFGTALIDGHRNVVLHDGHIWINATQAAQDYASPTRMEMPRDLEDLGAWIRAGLATSAFAKTLAAFARERGYSLGVAFDPVLPWRPGKVVAIGRNYRAHVKELGHAMPSEPVCFAKGPNTVIGPGEPIVIDDSLGRVDHEGELAVVIGEHARFLAENDAWEHIAGYTLLNDVTARDIQKRDIAAGNPWYRSKSIDTFCPLGPVLALREALPWPIQVDLSTTVNGEVRQQANTDRFLFPIPALIAYVSRYMTLEPGDVIATGTPEGVGPLKPGDTVEVACAPIGALRNPVAAAR